MIVKHYSKTRIAPTPSGFLHLGNVLSFAITAALAKKHGAKILLRIDDIDQQRVNDVYVQDIFDTLNFLEIPWDEGPKNIKEFKDTYSQLHRMPMYKDTLDKLHNSGKVFACNCSRKQMIAGVCNCTEKAIDLNTADVNWRLVTTDEDVVAIKSYNSEIIQAVLPAEMQSFVVRKKDGFPAYQLTSVVDDLYYSVDLVVRGKDLWSSTLAQHKLAAALGEDSFNDITFYHHPLIMEDGDKKLSKSAGATSIKHLRENGKFSADIYKLIADIIGIKQPVRNWRQLSDAVTTA